MRLENNKSPIAAQGKNKMNRADTDVVCGAPEARFPVEPGEGV